MAYHEVVVRTGKGKLRQEISAGAAQSAADEPLENGGEDTAATPHEILMGALGSCKAITMKLYANRKGWDLRSSEVRVTMKKEQETTLFTVKIHLEGNLDAEQRQRLCEIADRCPVHRTITGEVTVSSELV